jgi:hypothetical protein
VLFSIPVVMLYLLVIRVAFPRRDHELMAGIDIEGVPTKRVLLPYKESAELLARQPAAVA